MANTNKDPQFTAYIPSATLEALKASAQREHRSINAQLVWYIEQELEREERMDLKATFPTAAVNYGDTVSEQRFEIGQAVINIITFRSQYGDVFHAGIVIEQGEFDSGYFQCRSYVGNSLKDGKINPITAFSGTYDLTLDGCVVASFSYRSRQWRMINV
jgi:hypothetical protein